MKTYRQILLITNIRTNTRECNTMQYKTTSTLHHNPKEFQYNAMSSERHMGTHAHTHISTSILRMTICKVSEATIRTGCGAKPTPSKRVHGSAHPTTLCAPSSRTTGRASGPRAAVSKEIHAARSQRGENRPMPAAARSRTATNQHPGDIARIGIGDSGAALGNEEKNKDNIDETKGWPGGSGKAAKTTRPNLVRSWQVNTSRGPAGGTGPGPSIT